jgi:hypothetical protein
MNGIDSVGQYTVKSLEVHCKCVSIEPKNMVCIDLSDGLLDAVIELRESYMFCSPH